MNSRIQIHCGQHNIKYKSTPHSLYLTLFTRVVTFWGDTGDDNGIDGDIFSVEDIVLDWTSDRVHW